MNAKEELLQALAEARNSVANHEAMLKGAVVEADRIIEPRRIGLEDAQERLRYVESCVIETMDDAGVTSLHSDALHFTAYIHDTSGWRVLDEGEVIAALTEKGIDVPYQKPPKPKLNQTEAKKLAVSLGEPLPGMAYVESRSVQVKGTDR